jgi:hypothetical protein
MLCAAAVGDKRTALCSPHTSSRLLLLLLPLLLLPLLLLPLLLL